MEKNWKAFKKDEDIVDTSSLVVFPNARLPPKFKMPDMDKFDGTGCPQTHLLMYAGNMQPLGASFGTLAQLFQRTLTGAALRWFRMTSSRNWEDICNEFNNKDSYNIEVDVTKRDLESTKLQPNETFSEYLPDGGKGHPK